MNEQRQKAVNELLETLTLGETIQAEVLMPRIYINSFPKSGTHLAYLISAHLAQQQEPKHWLGSFAGHSWTTEWTDSEKILNVIKGQPAGTWYQGHLGYKKEFEKAFDEMNVCMLFIYRDLRDVAVSQTYHIESADGIYTFHPGKDIYMAMDSHEDRLMAVVKGVDKYPGIIERWKLFYDWIFVPWVLPIRYESMINEPKKVAEKAVNYILTRTTRGKTGINMMFAQNLVDAINKARENLGTTQYSTSYRKGKTGEWKKEFTPEIIKAFKETDTNYDLERIGYGREKEWQNV